MSESGAAFHDSVPGFTSTGGGGGGGGGGDWVAGQWTLQYNRRVAVPLLPAWVEEATAEEQLELLRIAAPLVAEGTDPERIRMVLVAELVRIHGWPWMVRALSRYAVGSIRESLT